MTFNIEEIITETERFIKTNDKEHTSLHYLWDTLKAVTRGKFIAISGHKKKIEKWQLNNLISHLKELGKKQKQNKKRK